MNAELQNKHRINITRLQQLDTVQCEAKEVFRRKNTDYGDAFATYGTIGVLVRLGDKINRLQSITSRGITLVEDEKLRDTLLDLHNYAAMAIMLMDNGDVLANVPNLPNLHRQPGFNVRADADLKKMNSQI